MRLTTLINNLYLLIECSLAMAQTEIPAHLNSNEDTADSVVNFSKPAGFYQSSFMLTLSAPLATDSIVYTLDGSNPYNSTTAYKSVNSTLVLINPASNVGRGVTPAVVVKAALLRNNSIFPHPLSHTYIFADKVLTQSYPSYSWPSSSVNSQVMDYEMAEDVVSSQTYAELVKPALLSLPSLCISTNTENLYNKSTGIYVNAGERGDAWERECSVELIYPDSTEGFSINAGLRIRGGASRSSGNPKHSFRLFFSSDYGASKLNYPLFGDEGPDKFDKVDLRTEQNYSWNGDSEENRHNTFVREIFSRDMQALMNQPYSKGRYYHLYLNGMYWGIYQTDERTDASYANVYFGGKKSDYDVIKVTPEVFPYVNEVTDGNDETWKILYDKCTEGFTSNNQYFRLEGKDENGNHVNESNVLVNIDNLIDYMLVIFYTGNFDAPTSAFWGNRMPNNYYAVYNRNNNADGFMFFAHDSEHSMMVDAVYTGNGLYEDRVNIATLTGWYQFDVEYFEDFNPQWIHYKLSKNKEYRQRFSDRAALYFNQGGLFTPERATAICQNRINQVDTAIVAESARWGDAQQSASRTKADWQTEIDVLLNDFFPYRTDIVKNQLIYAGIYYEIEKPVFISNNVELTIPNYALDDNVVLTIQKVAGTTGTIYYTLDGTDPRAIGGTTAEQAIAETNTVELNITRSTIITARVKSDGNWGPAKQVAFLSGTDDLSALKLTEVHYHPLDKIVAEDTISDKDLEFIEFKNTGITALNISGMMIDSAVTFTVPASTIIAPGKFYVIASDSLSFGTLYGIYPNGVFDGHLSNSSEQIIVNDSQGNSLIDMTYTDTDPWPEDTDGLGYSLTSTVNNPTANPANPEYWKNSSMLNGSPFSDDTVYVFVSNKMTVANQLLLYPNPTSDIITIQSPNGNNLLSIQIFTQSGQCIYAGNPGGETEVISLKSLNQKPGLYFIKITSNKEVETRKIILEN